MKTVKGRMAMFVVGIVLFIFPPIYGCKTEEHAKIQTTTVTSSHEVQFHKEGELTFFTAEAGKGITIDIEIPDTREEKTRGLMYRHSMTDTQGMLFIHDRVKYRSFWMKNTYLPLDMIFVDRKMQIIKIEKKTTPLSEELIAVPRDAYYTLEVNAGFCDRYGIKIGDSVQFTKIP